MSKDLSRRDSTAITVAVAQGQLEAFAGHKEVKRIQEEALKQFVAIDARRRKTLLGEASAAHIHDDAQDRLRESVDHTEDRLSTAKGDTELMDTYRDTAMAMFGDLARHMRGIAEVGVAGIASEVSKSVTPAPEEEKKKGLFGW